ncbi:NADPH-dependent FMN reductase [Enterovibrio norvegicus]|uniref:NADPH-dependent FMN reductase n=1 Tax=Enterovibrio norvegicus TaxID=188144 RepID=UPI00354FAE71
MMGVILFPDMRCNVKKILAISASSHELSINRSLLEVATSDIKGVAVDSLDMRYILLPLYNEDNQRVLGFPERLSGIKSTIREYDGYIIATPEHNGLMPAAFKNLLDWLARACKNEVALFGNKPVLIMSTSRDKSGGATNLNIMEKVLPLHGAKVVGSYSLGGYYDAFKDGKLNVSDQVALDTELSRFLRVVSPHAPSGVRPQPFSKKPVFEFKNLI